jgi:hypothetical protein
MQSRASSLSIASDLAASARRSRAPDVEFDATAVGTLAGGTTRRLEGVAVSMCGHDWWA